MEKKTKKLKAIQMKRLNHGAAANKCPARHEPTTPLTETNTHDRSMGRSYIYLVIQSKHQPSMDR